MIELTDNLIKLAWKYWFWTIMIGILILSLLAIASLSIKNGVSENHLGFATAAIFNYHFFIAGIGTSTKKKGSLMEMSFIERGLAVVNFYGAGIIGTVFILWVAVFGA